MFKSWKSRAAVFAVAATVAVPVLALASPARAAVGNSANAKACQNNGWNTLLTSEGTAFKNQGDCVSYGAQGGTYLKIGQCFDSATAFIRDLRLTGPVDTINNHQVFNSFNGTCSGAAAFTLTLVSAADATSAAAKCTALGVTGVSPEQLTLFGYPVPSDWWGCQ